MLLYIVFVVGENYVNFQIMVIVPGGFLEKPVWMRVVY